MIRKFLLLIAIISNVKCQFLPVTVSCPQANIPTALPPIYTKVSTLPNPLSVTTSPCTSPSPWTILNPKILPSPNQQFICPVEYTVLNPAIPLPISSVPTAPPVCCSPTSIPSPSPPLNDLCWPELDISLGCLDPILSIYGTLGEIPIPEISSCPNSPFLPAASPVSPLTPTIPALVPPLSPSESSCHFLKKMSIPPPFI